jgi:multiple sugar transport system ATP-binding protein
VADVVLSGIHKAFGDNPIVRGVDLQIRSGEFMVLVGPSGCGKTTLLRLIAGLERTDQGEIQIAGKVVNDAQPRERDVGMVFQSYALYPHMTVRENLAFGLTLRKLPKPEIDARVQEAAQLLELGALLERKPKQLSGGQRQRVAIGRCIVRRPAVFLFDEPLSNLDAALRVQMRGELARLHARLKNTMIYVTHDQVEAMTLATRLAVFNKGHLQQVGEPLELYARPANRFVAGFLGSPSMNFLTGKVSGGALVGAGYKVPLSGVEAHEGREVLWGVRPQALSVGKQGELQGSVDAVERLGSDGFVYLRTEAGTVAARFEGDGFGQVRVGDNASVRVPPEAIYLFDAQTEAVLPRADVAPARAVAP